MKNVYCLDLLQQYLTAHFGSCGFCDQSTCDLFHVLHVQFFITCDQFYTTSDQFEKGHGQNWSQKPQDPLLLTKKVIVKIHSQSP